MSELSPLGVSIEAIPTLLATSSIDLRNAGIVARFRVIYDPYVLDVWRHFLDQRNPFTAERGFKWRKASHVAPGP
jgi:hypothetical protein